MIPGRLIRWLVALAAAALLAACGADSPERLMQSARDYIAARDDRAAAIQLRNALQQQPRNAEARYLLGQVLARAGDYLSAEKELRRALEYGHPAERVYPELAQVLLALGQPKTVVSELADKDLADRDAQARLKSLAGMAHLTLGDLAAAQQAFTAALDARPGDPIARTGQARLAAIRRDFAAARRIVDATLVSHPKSIDALMLKADLLVAEERRGEAGQVLESVVAIQPHNAAAWTSLVGVHIDQGDLAGARAKLDAMGKAVPQDLRNRYLAAVIALRSGQLQKARDEVQQVLRLAPEHLPSQLLAGAVELELGSHRTAEEHFRRVLSRDPGHGAARNFLVATLLRAGEASRAEDVLAPALRASADDATLQRLAGEVALASGDVARAVKHYDRAAEIEKGSADVRARLAQLRFAAGDVDRGVHDLEAVSKLDPARHQADLALVALHLRRGERDKALATARGLAKRQPDNPLAHNVLGTVHLARGDPAAARQAYEHALKLEPAFLPAARNLARLDLDAKRPADARARFERIVAHDPGNEGALLSLAELDAGLGAKPADVLATLDRAVKANPASPRARMALVNYHLQQREPRAAAASAKEAAAANPDDARMVEMLGATLLSAGDPEQAAGAFAKLVELQPEAPGPLVRLAQAQAAAKNHDAAIQSMRRAVAMRPAASELARELIALHVAAGRREDALTEARGMQRARPRDPIGFALEGDVLMAQQRPAEAMTPYREALRRDGGAAAVIGLHRAALAAKRPADAEQALADWQKRHPQDVVVPAYLADADLRRGDHGAAAKRYRAILERQPQNVVVLNNYAWALDRLGDPAALGYAERAYKLAPGNAAVADTYGWMLVNRGEAGRGIEVLAQAVRAAPDNAEIRLHFGKALLKAGDRDAAKRELQVVADRGSDEQRSEAATLLRTL